MEFQNNTTAIKNGTVAQEEHVANQNDNVKEGALPTSKAPANSNAKADKPKPEPVSKQPNDKKVKKEDLPALQPQQEKVTSELSLEAKLKAVDDLYRRSVQRINLISRIKQLEAFEIALAQNGDELEDNPYQGCKLIIRDDKNREFVTVTPGLIRMVSQFIFEACNKKLVEIEATINFPGA